MATNNQGTILSIPDPETGYRYGDIVEIIGPVGQELFRDDLYPVYKIEKVITPSLNPTFSFEIMCPKEFDYFELGNNGVIFSVKSWVPEKWNKGYCVAADINLAENALKDFIYKGTNRNVKNLANVFDSTSPKAGNIDATDYEYKIIYPADIKYLVYAVITICIVMFAAVAWKTGLKTVSEIIAFILTEVFFLGVLIYGHFSFKISFRLLTNDKIIAGDFLRKNKIITLSKIVRIRYNRHNEISIYDNEGCKIKIPSEMHNKNEFIGIIREKLQANDLNVVIDKYPAGKGFWRL